MICVCSCVSFHFFLFFFFKQKTAYELRISDWSSDVCSSDLGEAGRDLARALLACDQHRLARFLAGPSLRADIISRRKTELGPIQIGSASCRERVWQYV